MTKTKPAPIDIADLSIVDEPYQDGRALQRTKYDETFAKLPRNKRLRCPAGRAGGLANSLRKWLTKRGEKDPLVKSRERCEDGAGGVWWLPGAENTVATAWQSDQAPTAKQAPKLKRAA